MRAADTNVLVRLITRDHPQQVKSAEAFIASGAWVSQLVLAETAWVLDAVYERTPQQIATTVEMLLDHETLVLQDADVVTAALECFRRHPAVGFLDCLLVATARKAGHLPIGTFDRALGAMEDAERL